MPVANISGSTSGLAAPPIIRPTPVPVPVGGSTQPIGPLDRAPDAVSAGQDPELPQPQSVPRVQVRTPAEVPVDTTTAASSILPQIEAPVPDIPVPDDSVTPNLPQYLTVSANGTIIVDKTTIMNFVGNGVAVTGNGSTALVTVVGDTTVLGNWAFTANTQYNLNGGSIDNSDLSHGATASLTVPGNGSTDALSLLNYYGNIGLTAAASPGSTKTWTFNTAGNIILPSNSASINYANGTPYGSTYGDANVANLLSAFGSNTISTTGNISGNLIAPDGNGSVLINNDGLIGAAPGLSYDANAGMLFSPAVTAQGSANTGINAFYGGIGGFTVLGSDVLVQLTSNLNSYTQINTQNINPGSFASSDYIITADNGTDSTYYLDLGLAGSGHADPDFFGDTGSANDGYLYVTATDQAGPSSGAGNLLIGSTNGVVKLFVGNTAQANVIATVASDGISVAGNIVGTGAINVGDMSIGTVPGDITANANTGITVNVSGPDGGFAVNYLDEVGNANTSGGELAFSSETGNATYRISLSDDLGNGFATKIWRFDGTGSLTAPGNITTTGNITGNYILGNGSQLTSVNANTVDILNTNGLTTVYYPTFVENRTTGQIVRADVDFSYRTDNNTLTVGNISTSGNITGNYILGNGSQLTGLPATYGNANVATFLASYGSNTISTSGNITAGNLIGNISITGNVTGTSANVDIIAGSYTWTFNNTGNFVLPGNTFAVNYANGTAVALGGNYGNANVADFLDSLGSNAIVTAGNVSGGNLITSGAATTGVNALLAGPTFTPLANTSAGFVANVNSYSQITFQNKNTGADATADYILTADNGSDTVNYGDFGIINSGYDVNTPTNSLGNIVRAGDTYIYAQGNVSNTSQSGGNLIIGTTVPAKNVKIFAGGANNNALVANISNTGMVVTGSVTATNFIGNVSLTGNIQGTSSNVELVAGSYTWTFDNTGIVTLPAVGGDEGGEINFAIPTANTTLTSPVKVDVYQDRIRFFDGSTKGAYIDMSQAGTGVSTLLNNRVSGYVNAGTYVTMDNLKATVSTAGNRSLQIATVSGSYAVFVNATYTLFGGGTAGTGATFTLTTTPTLAIAWNFTAQGDSATYIINDTTNSRCYRVTMMIGGSYNNNLISIERLI